MRRIPSTTGDLCGLCGSSADSVWVTPFVGPDGDFFVLFRRPDGTWSDGGALAMRRAIVDQEGIPGWDAVPPVLRTGRVRWEAGELVADADGVADLLQVLWWLEWVGLRHEGSSSHRVH